jgi:hypothetical protein
MPGTGTKTPNGEGEPATRWAIFYQSAEGEPATLPGVWGLSYSWPVAPQQSRLRFR